MVASMTGRLSAGLRAQASKIAETYQTAQAKAGGEAAGKFPYDLAIEQTKAAGHGEVAQIHANAGYIQQMLKQQAEMGTFGSPIPLPDGSGYVTGNKAGGIIFHGAEVNTNGVKSTPPPQYIPAPQFSTTITAKTSG
jgi:hypothetical protein